MTGGWARFRDSRLVTGGVVVLALAAALALRLARLDARPMHHDEANQAVKFGTLVETGAYRYDPQDHHGPTLYYFSLPSAWLRGERTLAALDERTLRAVPALVGAATILLLPLVSDGIGRTALVAAAWLLALSPAMVFYSRMYIQETLFGCFALACVIAGGRVAMGGGRGWWVLAGISAGLVVATKETAVIVLPAAAIAAIASWWSLGGERGAGRFAAGRWKPALLVSGTLAAVVAALFFTSFLAWPGDVLGPLRAASTYLSRGIEPVDHVEPWNYYLGLLAYHSSGGLRWSEGAVLALAAVGAVAAWLRPGAMEQNPGDGARSHRAFWGRYLSLYALIVTAIFSAIPYKTPWNLLPFYIVLIVLAGVGLSALLHWSASRVVRGAILAAFIVACAHLGWQAWRASVTYAADTRNPYVYAQTLPDAVRMVARIRQIAAFHADGVRMQVSVIASPYEQWPLPWYLRSMPNVGYWVAPGDAVALQAPVIVSSMEHTAALDRALDDRYVSEFYGLRPEVFLMLYVERGVWDRFLRETAAK